MELLQKEVSYIIDEVNGGDGSLSEIEIKKTISLKPLSRRNKDHMPLFMMKDSLIDFDKVIYRDVDTYEKIEKENLPKAEEKEKWEKICSIVPFTNDAVRFAEIYLKSSIVINEDFTERDKEAFLSDGFAITEFAKWFVSNIAIPFFQKLNQTTS